MATLEAYLNLEYGPKHSETLEKFSTCAKLAVDDFSEVEVRSRLAWWFRQVAQDLDPHVVCDGCGQPRYVHSGNRCLNKYGPWAKFPLVG